MGSKFIIGKDRETRKPSRDHLGLAHSGTEKYFHRPGLRHPHAMASSSVQK